MEIVVISLAVVVLILLGTIVACAKEECKLKTEIEVLSENLQSRNACIAELADKFDKSERKRAQLHVLRDTEFRVCSEVIKERDKLKEDLVNAEARYGQMKLLCDSELRTCHSVSTERDSLRLSLAGANQEIKKLHETRGSLQREYNELHGKCTQLQLKLSRVESALKPPASVNDAGKPVYWNLPQDFKDMTFASIFGRA